MTFAKTLLLAWSLLSWTVVKTSAQASPTPAALDRFVQAMFEKSRLPGMAVAIVDQHGILLVKGYGTQANHLPITAETPFAIASLSKAFTATAVMQLVEAGRLDLDAPVTAYLPWFALHDRRADQVTVRHLLHQTSGLSDRVFPEMAFSRQPRTLEEALSRLKTVHLASAPGQAFHYHNPNYHVLAKVVEAISQEPFSHYLQQHLFTPLGMQHTWNVSDTKSFYTGAHRLPKGHTFLFGKPVALQEPDWFIEGAAGMVSTPRDMARWLLCQLNGGRLGQAQLLSDHSLQVMHSTPRGTGFPYGMGWFVNGPNSSYHNGILWTYSAEQILLRDRRYGIVFLFNSGLNAFVDYYSFTQGLVDLLNHQQPQLPLLSHWFYEACLGALVLVTLLMGIRHLRELKHWQNKYKSRPAWRSGLSVLLRLFPLLLLVCLPGLLMAMSGRVLSWERIFWMMPSIVIELGLWALVSLVVLLARFILLFKNKLATG